MLELFILIAHLLVTLAKLGTRGGLGAVAAESSWSVAFGTPPSSVTIWSNPVL